VADEANELAFCVIGSLCVASVRGGVVIGSVDVASVWNIMGCDAIASDSPCVDSFTWCQRYSRKVLLFKWPRSMIAAVRTFAI
jgi:hypothetical protein